MPISPELSASHQQRPPPPTLLQPASNSLGDRNKSALELSCDATAADDSCTGGLRKVASIGNYDFLKRDHPHHTAGADSAGGPLRTFSAHHLFPSHFGGGQQHAHHPISTIPEDQSDQGLMMTMRSNSLVPNNPLASASTSALGSACSAGGGLGSACSTGGGLNANSLSPSGDPSMANQQRSASFGGVMGMFGRGFFAKPVIRSEEDNYRYIMALDR